MATRTVLLVTYHFPPSAAIGGLRMLGLARHLPRFGWRAAVVAPPCLDWEPVDAALLRRVPSEVGVRSAPFPRGTFWKPLGWLAPYGVWLPRGLKACREALRLYRPDAVLTSGPPHCVHLLGLLLKRWDGLPWIADFRDTWIDRSRPEAPSGQKVPRWHRWGERTVLRHADLVVSNTPLTCACLQRAFPEYRDKIVSVANGYDPEDFDAPPLREPSSDPLVILHAGELYWGRDPRPFLDALQSLCADPAPRRPVRVLFLGRNTDKVDRIDLEAEVRRRGLEGIVSLGGQVSHEESLRAMTGAGILLVLVGPTQRLGVPAKLYEYLGAGRPILALAEPDGDVARVLRASGVPHRIAPLGDATAICRALVELIEDINRGAASPPAPEQLFPFTREYMAGQLAQFLDAQMARRPLKERDRVEGAVQHSSAPKVGTEGCLGVGG